MDVQISLDHAALARIIAALEAIDGGDLRRLIVDAVANDSVLKRTANYPDNRRVGQPFKSDKQRRWFFAALRKGQISVPYQRTGTLGRGWRYDAGASSVVNTVPYAGQVMGDDQSDYFGNKGWLSTTFIAAESERNDVPWIAQGAVSLWIMQRGLG